MKKPIYDARIEILGDVAKPFGDNKESLECLYILNKYNVYADAYNKKSLFTEKSLCVPVRIALNADDPNEDWTCFGSPIEENEYGNIIKYWPVEILNKQDINIVYPDFEIRCKEYVMKDQNEEIKEEPVKEEEVKEEPVKAKKKLPKWAVAALIGTGAAITVGVVSGIVLHHKKSSEETEEEVDE